MPHVVLLGTLDSKLDEFAFLYNQLVENAVKVTLVDCGRGPNRDSRINITQDELVRKYGDRQSSDVSSLPRGELVQYMAACAGKCVSELIKSGGVHGILSAGGSSGSSLAASVMRQAPIGMPKLLVSTIASGDTGPLVGETDITMMYSVVDIAGTNTLLRTILSNAAAAMAGMATSYERRPPVNTRSKRRIGITMFGVTTPGVEHIRKILETQGDAEVYVFHATGHGGRAMGRLVSSGELDAVIDLTTTEICDHLMGGNMSAGEERLEAPLRAGIPYILSLGATDMVNFGPRPTVPEKYKGRKLFEHNPSVTLMRTTKEECEQIGDFIVDKVTKHAKDPAKVKVFLPCGGVSMIATPGGPFADDEADAALGKRVWQGLKSSGVEVIEREEDINNEGFAKAVASTLLELVKT